MKGWKRDIEKSVVWRREEGFAVRKKLGGGLSGNEAGAEACCPAHSSTSLVEVKEEAPIHGVGGSAGLGGLGGKGEPFIYSGSPAHQPAHQPAHPEPMVGVGSVGSVQTGYGWGVGGRTWEKGSGRCPTQREWEGLFAERVSEDSGGGT